MRLIHRPLDLQSGALPRDHRAPRETSVRGTISIISRSSLPLSGACGTRWSAILVMNNRYIGISWTISKLGRSSSSPFSSRHERLSPTFHMSFLSGRGRLAMITCGYVVVVNATVGVHWLSGRFHRRSPRTGRFSFCCRDVLSFSCVQFWSALPRCSSCQPSCMLTSCW